MVVEQPQSTRVEEPTLLCNQVENPRKAESGLVRFRDLPSSNRCCGIESGHELGCTPIQETSGFDSARLPYSSASRPTASPMERPVPSHHEICDCGKRCSLGGA